MIAIVAQAAMHAVTSAAYGAASTLVGIIVIGLLTVLLIGRGLLEAYAEGRFARQKGIIDRALVPLLVGYGLLVLLRVGHLMHVL